MQLQASWNLLVLGLASTVLSSIPPTEQSTVAPTRDIHVTEGRNEPVKDGDDDDDDDDEGFAHIFGASSSSNEDEIDVDELSWMGWEYDGKIWMQLGRTKKERVDLGGWGWAKHVWMNQEASDGPKHCYDSNKDCEEDVKASTWGEWSEFSKCSVTCGSGVRIRHRKCPLPGRCYGDANDEQTCFKRKCPNDKADRPHKDDVGDDFDGTEDERGDVPVDDEPTAAVDDDAIDDQMNDQADDLLEDDIDVDDNDANDDFQRDDDVHRDHSYSGDDAHDDASGGEGPEAEEVEIEAEDHQQTQHEEAEQEDEEPQQQDDDGDERFEDGSGGEEARAESGPDMSADDINDDDDDNEGKQKQQNEEDDDDEEEEEDKDEDEERKSRRRRRKRKKKKKKLKEDGEASSSSSSESSGSWSVDSRSSSSSGEQHHRPHLLEVPAIRPRAASFGAMSSPNADIDDDIPSSPDEANGTGFRIGLQGPWQYSGEVRFENQYSIADQYAMPVPGKLSPSPSPTTPSPEPHEQ